MKFEIFKRPKSSLSLKSNISIYEMRVFHSKSNIDINLILIMLLKKEQQCRSPCNNMCILLVKFTKGGEPE